MEEKLIIKVPAQPNCQFLARVKFEGPVPELYDVVCRNNRDKLLRKNIVYKAYPQNADKDILHVGVTGGFIQDPRSYYEFVFLDNGSKFQYITINK